MPERGCRSDKVPVEYSIMKTLTDAQKYYECLGTLEHIVRALRFAYNQGIFNPIQKKYIFSLLREGDNTIKKISE
jgi:hypothetical protein